MNPVALTDWILKIASHSEAAFRVENVEADAVRPLGCFGSVVAVVHAKHPLVLAGFAFAHPVDVPRTFPIRKVQRIGPQPRRDGELAGCADTEAVARWNFDIVVDSIEAQIDIALIRRRTHEICSLERPGDGRKPNLL